jgi:hypothetical protein
VDVIAVVLYLIAANPAITGLALHEWASLGLVLVFFIHCALNYELFTSAFRKKAGAVARANVALDVVILATFMVCVVSGIMVSRFVLPAFGLVAQGYFFWNPLHAISAKLLLTLLLVHIVVHWKWLAARFAPKAADRE